MLGYCLSTERCRVLWSLSLLHCVTLLKFPQSTILYTEPDLRNLYAGQEATVRTGHGTADWFQIGKGVRQGCILSPCLFN